MTDQDNNASISFSPDTKGGEDDDTTVESPLPTLEEGILSSGGRPGLTRRSSRLSSISKQYDIDGDGILDETEQAMRDLDRSGRGHLSNQVVYKVLKEQLAMQRELLNKKRLIIFLSVFTVVLALSNLGTAWAAAMLAKDTTTQNDVLVDKASGNVVATNTNADTFVLESVNGRRRTQNGVYGLMALSKAKAAEIHRECLAGGSVRLERIKYPGTYHETTISMPLCPGGSSASIGTDEEYIFKLPNGRDLVVDCTQASSTMSGVAYCAVTGDGLKLDENLPCELDDECVHGYCFTSDKGAFLPPDWPGRCKCNPGTSAGCTSPKTCWNPEDITDAMGISDTSPGCFLNFGAPQCNSDSDCLTFSCDTSTNTCACNELTNFGCATGQTCVNMQCV